MLRGGMVYSLGEEGVRIGNGRFNVIDDSGGCIYLFIIGG
jgi:hypothetical protein